MPPRRRAGSRCPRCRALLAKTVRAASHRFLLTAASILAAVVIPACGDTGGGTPGATPEPPNTLHVLAGSELTDIASMAGDIRDKTGVNLVFDYVGTLDGSEQIANGDIGNHQLAWFSSTKYLSLLPGGAAKLTTSKRIMTSPVILGVKHHVAAALGWSGNPNVSWKDVAQAAQSGQFKYGMTNPSSSNTGFSALVGVATALSGTSNALTSADVNAAALTGFFKGQALTAGSSGFLSDTFTHNQASADGLINYESVLLGLNAGGQLAEKLDLIYPKDGIVTADYPLVLLDPTKRDLYDKLTTYLTSTDFQTKVMTQTYRRPTTAAVALDSRFPTQVLIETSFPSSLDVVDSLIQQYLDAFSKPSHTIYVLDLSGSMQGDRLSQLQAAFHILTDQSAQGTARFARFRSREKVTIITFSDTVLDQKDFDIADATQPNALKPISDYVDSLQANGGTAIYSAMDQAFQVAATAKQTDPGDFVSVVLMTDGMNNEGESSDTFLNNIATNGPHDVPAFPILFGEGDPTELTQIAQKTNGKLFDSTTTSLALTFKQIRGYQ